MTNLSDQELVFSDGYRSHMRRWESESGADETVLALHGLIGHSGVMDGLGRQLAGRPGIACVGYDRRGTGECTAARGDSPGIERTVDDVIEAAERAAGGRPVHVLAWCGSGGFAGMAIERAPHLFKTLTLLSPLFPEGETAFAMGKTQAFLARAEGRPLDELLPAPDFVHAFVDEPDVAQFVADERILKLITKRLIGMFVGAIGKTVEILPRLSLPQTAIVATRDRIVDCTKSRANLQKWIKPERLFEVPGAHAPWFTCGQEVGDIFERVTLGR